MGVSTDGTRGLVHYESRDVSVVSKQYDREL